MTKDLLFDIEFTSHGPESISERGGWFLFNNPLVFDHKELYRKAIDSGLHIRFANAEIRDYIAGVE